MSYQEELVHMMRRQGSYYNSPDMQIGEMKTDTICMVGDNLLSKEDYKVMEIARGKLKEGDDVLVLPITDDDNDLVDFVILGKVVKP
ncbi:hypothetical protein NE619_13110 [Anaerovorax odorimutans]|uniref:Uncharacterized protein n=1 Tax=Anaerovorax odorimutans TaxID=109327 RepID=A0ABT1RR83_9FIRM|nr:hypothetical protein [Anaerovorax odorimutans]MCQ4637666.1 hypothetical protein [Anaerovorax odorimutans]